MCFQLTKIAVEKELKHCRHVELLEVNENVKAKVKKFVKTYMARCGPVYEMTTTTDDIP